MSDFPDDEYVFEDEDINDHPEGEEQPFNASAPDEAILARWEERLRQYNLQSTRRSLAEQSIEEILSTVPHTTTTVRTRPPSPIIGIPVDPRDIGRLETYTSVHTRPERQVIPNGIRIAVSRRESAAATPVYADDSMMAYESEVRISEAQRLQDTARQRSNLLLYGDLTTIPVYHRTFDPTPFHSKFARVRYDLAPATINRPDAIDAQNAAIIRARFTFEDVMQLLTVMFDNESRLNFPGTTQLQQINTVFVFFNREGLLQPKPIYIPAKYFYGGFKGTALNLMASAQMMEMVDTATQEVFNGSDFETIYGEQPASNLIPTGFGCSIIDPNRSVPSGTQVNALSKKQQIQAGRAQMIAGHPVVNLDGKMNGYCLFETMVALGKEKYDVERVISMCGDPAPKDIVIENIATDIANIVRVNFRFFKINAEKKAVEFYHTQTAFDRTEDLLVCVLGDRDNPDENYRLYRHVYHMVNGAECKDAAPFEDTTVFVNFDLETVADDECVNRAWALNLLAYRMPPSMVTSTLYDSRQLQLNMQALNIDTGAWVPVLRDVPDGPKVDKNGKAVLKRVINSEVVECAKIYYDGVELKALKYLIEFLVAVKQHMMVKELNIVLVGFNSSRFDNFILVPYCTDELKMDSSRFKVGIYGNSVLTLTMYLREQGIVVSTFDLRRHTVGSLRGNCRMWGVPEGAAKGDLDHALIQMCYDINHTNANLTMDSGEICACFNNFIEANKKDIETYCKQDVIATAVLHMIYKTSMEFIVNKHFITKHGASMGMIAMIGTLSAVHKKNKVRGAIAKAMNAVTSTHGPALENEVLRIKDSKERVGKVLARIGITKEARDVIRAIREVRPPVKDCDLPFLIKDFSIYDREPLPELLTTMIQRTRVAETRDAAIKQLTTLLWSKVGGLMVSKKFNPNVEQHPTLASFATQIFKAICSANEMIQVGGFRYDITKALRRHLCRAGRSEAHIGTYEDFPIFILDIVSLYPTSMTCQKMLYALGTMINDKKVVRCTHRTAYVEPVDGVMRAGIWKVQIHKQPHGVVIPAQDKTGYYWDRDCAHEMTTLLTTPDVESLKIARADFTVQEGLTFDDATNQLYTEYISIFQSEKGRQDDLKKGKPVQLFDGELYSAGVREATKLGMNILSGKEITRPYTKKREIIHSEQVATSQDTANEQRQVALSMQARAAIDDPMGNSLVSWRRKITKARQIPRLVEPPTKIGPSTWVAEWREIPKTASYSHINGYHIYGVARWIMTQIYSTIGYDKFYVTETDSLAMNYHDIPKLYPLTSCFGDPLIFANSERAMRLFPDAPVCTKSKQFGQLESETTEKLQEFLAKEFHLEPPQIKTIEYAANSEIVLNGNPTGLRGPFLCVGGKKIYAQYMLTPTGERKYIKARFKGLTFGQDWVVEPMRLTETVNGVKRTHILMPELFRKMSLMKRSERVRYALTQLADFKRADIHRLQYSDIANYIRDKKLYVVQSRVSESSAMSMTSKQNIVMKELELRSVGPDDSGKREIHLRTKEVERMSLRAMGRAIQTCGDDEDSKCEMCDEQGSLIIDFKNFCAAHKPAEEDVRPLCKHRNRFAVPDCAEFAEKGGYCVNHQDFRHNHDVNIYCEHEEKVGSKTVKCRELANPVGILKGINRCNRHLKTDDTCPTAVCMRQYKYLKHGSLKCQDLACEKAIRSGYQLCYRHYLENNGAEKERNVNAVIDKARVAVLLSEIAHERQETLSSNIPGTVVYCNFMLRGKKPCGKQIEIERVGPGVTYCRAHAKREAFLAKKAASAATENTPPGSP